MITTGTTRSNKKMTDPLPISRVSPWAPKRTCRTITSKNFTNIKKKIYYRFDDISFSLVDVYGGLWLRSPCSDHFIVDNHVSTWVRSRPRSPFEGFVAAGFAIS